MDTKISEKKGWIKEVSEQNQIEHNQLAKSWILTVKYVDRQLLYNFDSLLQDNNSFQYYSCFFH